MASRIADSVRGRHALRLLTATRRCIGGSRLLQSWRDPAVGQDVLPAAALPVTCAFFPAVKVAQGSASDRSGYWEKYAALASGFAASSSLLLATSFNDNSRSAGALACEGSESRSRVPLVKLKTRRSLTTHVPSPEEAGRTDLVVDITYLEDPSNGAQRLYLMMYKDSGRPEVVQYGQARMRVSDARQDRAGGRLSLDTNGLTMVQHRSNLRSEDFYATDGKRLRSEYYAEVEEAIRRATGAEAVIAFHHTLRNEEKALELVAGDWNKLMQDNSPLVRVGGYARHAHADYTASTAATTARQQLLTVEDATLRQRLARGRYVLFNAWRSISDTEPVQNHHLAILDASTLSVDDLVAIDLHYETFSSESMQVRKTSQGAARHQWLYFPGMTKDELLIFKQYDSDAAAPARCAVHCAIEDPAVDSTAPPRESIEVRAIAFFPDQPGTHTEDILKPQCLPPAKEVAGRLLASIETPHLWPEDTRSWLTNAVDRDPEAAAADLIHRMISWHADPTNLAGDMPGASPAMKSEVKRLLQASAFAERLQRSFGSADAQKNKL
eukprot:TRINITY_DN54814_c1_g1_i1.p1 TRINITY_DN54814_c1_g1~~TRINITY_DN54814_c1_g1_i1.p1  ORF type:complete len:581 (+),score=74.91 TRINITY_DN54814_c1_g1_i1:84-1745(+)